MPNRSDVRNVWQRPLLTTVADATTPQTSAAMDTLGFDSATFVVHFGTDAPAPTSMVVEESDDGSTWAAAPATSVISDFVAAATYVNKSIAIGYVGTKRHTRLVVTPNGATDFGIGGRMTRAAGLPLANPY